MWLFLKKFLGSLGIYLYIQLRIYSLWSKLYQFMFQKDFRAPIELHSGYSSIVNSMRSGKLYKSDGPRELWDAIGHPEYVQWVINKGEAPMGMDCDEHAIYIVAALNCAIKSGVFVDSTLLDAKLLTISWIDKKGKFGGHNVALLRTRVVTFYPYAYSFMDYGFPSKAKGSINEIVDDVVHRYGGLGAKCIGWSTQDENLKVQKVTWR